MARTDCPKCGAPLEYDVGTLIVECSYCDTSVFIDKSGAHYYYILRFYSDGQQAMGIFRRWAAGPKKAKNLDSLASVQRLSRQYFPIYMFRRRVGDVESVLVEPAKLTMLPGFRSLKVPPGDIKVFDKEFNTGDAEVLEPDIDISAYLPSLPGGPVEQALVYFPVWRVEYTFRGKSYECIIDGSSGEVFSDLFPVRGSGPYVAVSLIGFAAFFGEGLLLLINASLAVILIGVTAAVVLLSGVYVAKKF
ncbi:MAG: zinc ribbon domain-containing protein [Thermoplasmata archaeon]